MDFKTKHWAARFKTIIHNLLHEYTAVHFITQTYVTQYNKRDILSARFILK